MIGKLSGGCLCGAVRYECDSEKIMASAICHCRDCQYVSGGGPANIVGVPDPAFELLKGETKGFTVKSEGGNDVTRHFCAECGTPMFSELSTAPGLKIIKVGTFDDPGSFKPQMTVWTSSAPPWAHIDADLPQFPKDPG